MATLRRQRRRQRRELCVRGSDLIQVLFMAAIWGGSFLFLRVATPEFGAIPLIAVRVAIAAIMVLPVFALQPAWRLEFRQNFWPLLVLGLLNAAIPFPFFAYVTLYVSAGFASIINATAPLFAALVASLWLGDRLTRSAVLGLFVGFLGVVILAGGLPTWRGGAGLAVLGALFSCLCYGLAASHVKRHLAGVNSWVTTTASFGLAAVLLAPLAAFQWPAEFPSARAWWAVILLGVLGTSLANIYYFRLVVRVGPARAMSVAFLIPVFGMLWGALWLNETVTPVMLWGCAVILAGTALVTGAWRLVFPPTS
jgi:drug/metabolite transporter (DMT)-like permease